MQQTLRDLANTLAQYLDDIAGEAIQRGNSPRAEALRLKAGECIVVLQESLEDLDYEYTLHSLGLSPELARNYKQLYITSIKAKLQKHLESAHE